MAELKTLLFTDILGSVELKSELPGHSVNERDEAFIDVILTPHRQRIEQELVMRGGRVVSTAGDGHFLVFSDVVSAAQWAISILRSHRNDPIVTPRGRSVQVRISIHLGSPQIDPSNPNNFIGKAVDYAARLNDYATGQQILVSPSVVAVLQDAGISGISFHRHGERELKGIGVIELSELVYDRVGPHEIRSQQHRQMSPSWTVLPPKTQLSEWREGAIDSKSRQVETAVLQVSPSPAPLPRLGNYELMERLGSGGMGEVYKARHMQFNRLRAVKVIRQSLLDAGNTRLVPRFYQEIKAIGKLDHPNIVVAIESSSPEDTMHYLVMEYIDGISLDELVKRHGTLQAADACEIARQAARGLAYIHQHDLVHRDIKPSNLMLTVTHGEPLGTDAIGKSQPADEAVVKILDLGLALLIDDDQQRLTRTDQAAMGTAMYMSPEQFKSPTVDIRSDIYSLGCTLYHLLAGMPPFWESDLKPERAHEREALPRSPLEHLPTGLWELLLQMTAKNPNDRFSSPLEAALALAPFAERNQLTHLVSVVATEKRKPSGSSAKFDTLVHKSAASDTKVRTPVNPSPSSSPSVLGDKVPLKYLRSALTLAGVVLIGWLTLSWWEHRPNASQNLTIREDRLQSTAGRAAERMMREIEGRFNAINDVASSRDKELDLPNELHQIALTDDGEEREKHLKELRLWLSDKRDEKESQAVWNIYDQKGIQLARVPRGKEKTIGKNYAYRDYFHGRGENLVAGVQTAPISKPHLSAAVRSDADGKLRVVFAVPIKNGDEVIGVMTMAVDLGDFSVLNRGLPESCEIVLISLHPETIDNIKGRGLVLHHGRAGDLAADAQTSEKAEWLSADLLSRIDEALGSKTRRSGRPEILKDYRDPIITHGDTYWGALQQINSDGSDRLVVLVQEPQPF